jgi:hypothetical protein
MASLLAVELYRRASASGPAAGPAVWNADGQADHCAVLASRPPDADIESGRE